MQNGLYLAQFAVPSMQGQGRQAWEAAHGVVYIRDGKAFGGDSAYWWTGDIAVNGDDFSAALTVKVHTSGSQSIFGFLNEFNLKVQGKRNNEAWQGEGETNAAPGRTMQLNLRMLQAD